MSLLLRINYKRAKAETERHLEDYYNYLAENDSFFLGQSDINVKNKQLDFNILKIYL